MIHREVFFMLDWFLSFGNFLSSIIDFIVSFFTNVVEIVVLVFKGFNYLISIVVYLPVQYQAIIIAFISFCVIRTVIHFGG